MKHLIFVKDSGFQPQFLMMISQIAFLKKVSAFDSPML